MIMEYLMLQYMYIYYHGVHNFMWMKFPNISMTKMKITITVSIYMTTEVKISSLSTEIL